jgi:glycine/sarcosine N-methyltransferase
VVSLAFYADIESYYEDIFPAGSSQVLFLKKLLAEAGASTVLDVACGTGAYARALAELGYKVTGVDFEEAMVRAAQNKAKQEDFPHPPRFLQGDMRCLEEFAGDFDAVLCLGNSLPHLLKDEDIQAFFQGSKNALRTVQGLLVLQTVNYDRILKNQAYDLPLIKNDSKNLRFERKYLPRPDQLLDFETELTIQGQEGVLHSVPLRPLTQEDLHRFLVRNGFSPPLFYGSFAGESWSDSSPATVLVARPGH